MFLSFNSAIYLTCRIFCLFFSDSFLCAKGGTVVHIPVNAFDGLIKKEGVDAASPSAPPTSRSDCLSASHYLPVAVRMGMCSRYLANLPPVYEDDGSATAQSWAARGAGEYSYSSDLFLFVRPTAFRPPPAGTPHIMIGMSFLWIFDRSHGNHECIYIYIYDIDSRLGLQTSSRLSFCCSRKWQWCGAILGVPRRCCPLFSFYHC